MDLEQIQRLVEKGQWRMTTHAVVEAAKDGVSPKDVKKIILTGKIIESYPDRDRHLVYGTLTDMSQLPVHVVVDYSNSDQVVAVTAYVPDDQEWIASQRRKR